MGEVISKKASADAIYEDVATTLTEASQRDDRWKLPAVERLTPVTVTHAALATRRKDAAAAVKPLIARRDVVDGEVDDKVAGEYDMLWNAAGRPATDPVLDVIFPGGSSYYTEDDVEGQPLRLELLAELLETIPHSRIPAEVMKASATRVREWSKALADAVQATLVPVARLALVERTYTAFAKTAQYELSRVKRIWRAAGFSEADIHAVIPDRPSKTKVPTPKPTPQPGTPS